MVEQTAIGKDTLYLLFDLETSSRLFLGQILSASFQLVDADLNPVSGYAQTWYGQISPLELPEPQAMLINGLSPSFLQNKGLIEKDLAQAIYNFIRQVKQSYQKSKIFLTGFNSGNFDLPYLRTVLIRNGLNPYQDLKYLDVLKLARFLAFHFKPLLPPPLAESQQPSFKLENLSRHFGIIGQKDHQLHEAAADVELTRLLLKKLKPYCGLLGSDLSDYPFTPKLANFQTFSIAALKENGWKITTQVLVGLERNSFFLLTIGDFQDKRDLGLLRYYNLGLDPLMIAPQQIDIFAESSLVDKMQQIKQLYAGVTAREVFGKSTCDIEQDIYRLNFGSIEAVKDFKNILSSHYLSDKDLEILKTRYCLRNNLLSELTASQQLSLKDVLKKYYQDRYLVGLKTNKRVVGPEYGGDKDGNSFSTLYIAMDDELTKLQKLNPQASNLGELRQLFEHKKDLLFN